MAATTLTREAYERLRAELEDLTTRGRIEIARKIEEARALGDLSENGDYHAAKESQGHMELRIRQLEALLKDAEVIDGAQNTGQVGIGSLVTLDFGGGDEEHFLVGNPEERREGHQTVSPSSPLGAALMEHVVGDTVEWQVGNNKPLSAKIVAIGV
jgi:transcription elongation factor GreA